MQIAPLTRIDCMLLHATVEGLPKEELKAAAMAVLTAAGLTPVEDETVDGQAGQALAFRAGGWRLRVHAVPAPLAPETLHHVLTLPYTRTVFPNAEQAIRAHAGHIRLSLEKAAKGAEEKDTPFTDSREVMPAMSLVALLAREIMSRLSAAAVYWAASDHLLPPALFQTFTSDSRLILLNIRPQYFAGNALSDAAESVGMVAWGTQHLIGKLLVFEPAAIAPGDLHALAAGTVSAILQKEKIPETGERLSVPGLAWQAVVQADAQPLNGPVRTLRLLPVPHSAKRKADVAATFKNMSAPDAHRAADGAATSLPDLAELPPELREEILEQRRRRGHVDSGTDMGAFRTTAMNAVAGFLVLFLAANFLIGRIGSLTEPPPRTSAPATQATAAGPAEIERPAGPNRMSEEERSERLATISERIRDGEDAAYEERPGDEEREARDADTPVDEEKELQDQPDTVPDGEVQMAAPRGREDEYDPETDEEREDEDLVRD